MIPRVKCLPVLPETVGEGAPKTRVNWALGERVSSCISELGYFEIGLWRLNKGKPQSNNVIWDLKGPDFVSSFIELGYFWTW